MPASSARERPGNSDNSAATETLPPPDTPVKRLLHPLSCELFLDQLSCCCGGVARRAKLGIVSWLSRMRRRRWLRRWLRVVVLLLLRGA